MIGIENCEFKKIIKVRCNNILEGLDKFNNGIIKNNKSIEGNIESKLKGFLLDCYEEDKELIVDYYGNVIMEEEFNKMISFLGEDEKKMLIEKKISSDREKISFIIKSIDFLNIIIKLSINEILFSTFYFARNEVTIWSNYDKEFVILFKDSSNIEKYKKIAENNGLIIDKMIVR